jgi:hypothetical protein
MHTTTADAWPDTVNIRNGTNVRSPCASHFLAKSAYNAECNDPDPHLCAVWCGVWSRQVDWQVKPRLDEVLTVCAGTLFSARQTGAIGPQPLGAEGDDRPGGTALGRCMRAYQTEWYGSRTELPGWGGLPRLTAYTEVPAYCHLKLLTLADFT